MKTIHRKPLLAISAAALLLGLAGCDRADERTAAERNEASTRAGQTAQGARREARDATASAGAAADRAAESTKAMGAAAADDTRAMGAAAADKTRALGSAAADKVDDASVTAKVNAALVADKELSALRIDVDTQNGVVTLSGPAPTASAKERATEVAHRVKGVTSVNNQLTIKAS
ncbi:BON domain-containing protein [Ramlibacter sp.]|uniref:BON domain-containing protein n=1 Tax=Ramlibacter sp. TaxID=1917967 RepID=UPI002CD7BC50|nr:BON domain-containing protein [Ramlibacter sp.]HWI82877.1 BON domain-containing protein [Ramlibacter sp.]